MNAAPPKWARPVGNYTNAFIVVVIAIVLVATAAVAVVTATITLAPHQPHTLSPAAH